EHVEMPVGQRVEGAGVEGYAFAHGRLLAGDAIKGNSADALARRPYRSLHNLISSMSSVIAVGGWTRTVATGAISSQRTLPGSRASVLVPFTDCGAMRWSTTLPNPRLDISASVCRGTDVSSQTSWNSSRPSGRFRTCHRTDMRPTASAS